MISIHYTENYVEKEKERATKTEFLNNEQGISRTFSTKSISCDCIIVAALPILQFTTIKNKCITYNGYEWSFLNSIE